MEYNEFDRVIHYEYTLNSLHNPRSIPAVPDIYFGSDRLLVGTVVEKANPHTGRVTVSFPGVGRRLIEPLFLSKLGERATELKIGTIPTSEVDKWLS